MDTPEPEGQPSGLALITLDDKDYFTRTFARLAQPISDYSFSVNYIWGGSFPVYWARIQHHLCIFANGTGDLTMLVPPVPEPEASNADLIDCLIECFHIMDRYNDLHATRACSRIEYVSDEMLERILAVTDDRFSLSSTSMSGDYIYKTARMIDLAGGDLKSKRHARNKFVHDHPDHRITDLNDSHLVDCHQLLDIWYQYSDEIHHDQVTCDTLQNTNLLRRKEFLACQQTLVAYKELGLKGMVLFVGDQLIGFTFGEVLSPVQCSILIEKTHPQYHGAAQFIFSEFCRLYWAAYPECNAGDDWGIPSLRFTKTTYRPTRMLNKYILTRQPVVVTGIPSVEPTLIVPIQSDSNAGVAIYPLPMTCESVTLSEPEQPGPTDPTAIPFTLRAATCGDIQAILALEQSCFDSPAERFNLRQLRDLIHNSRAIVIVADTGKHLIGWTAGLTRQHRINRSARLYALAVAPFARGLGCGQALASLLCQRLTDCCATRIYLEVRPDNMPAIRLYEQLGFQYVKQLPDYYETGRHAVKMRRIQQPNLLQSERNEDRINKDIFQS